MYTIYFSQFQGTDTTHSFALAMQYLKENPGTTLIIEPGTYTITTELARKTQEAVFNGDYGQNPTPIMFNRHFAYSKGIDFAGQKGSRIIAHGVTLMVDGYMEPLSLNHCEDIEICGLTIDHVRKPYSHGTITSIDRTSNTEKMSCLVELAAGFALTPHTPLFFRQRYYDPVADTFNLSKTDRYEFIDPYHIRIFLDQNKDIHEGMEFYFRHTGHFRPAILIEHAKDIRLIDVTIHSQPGMGIVGNRSENILMKRLAIIPSCGEHWSTNADATHFTSITGTLRFEDCISEAHGDDFTNVHAYYHAVIEKEAPNICYMQEKTPEGTHAQTLDYPDVGDTLELTDRNTFQLIDTFKVLDCVPMHEEWMCKVVLDHPLPENTDDLIFADVTRLPRVEVVGCTITSHYARSVLIKTRDTLIERNFFKNAHGMAIELAAEGYWYEGVCPANAIIRNNRIVNCGCRESAGVVVKADCANAVGQSIYNIVVEDNIIDVPFAAHAIYIRNVDGLKVARNKCICYDQAVIIKDCIHVESDV